MDFCVKAQILFSVPFETEFQESGGHKVRLSHRSLLTTGLVPEQLKDSGLDGAQDLQWK